MRKLKSYALFLLCICLAFCFTACSDNSGTVKKDNDKLSIICTIFPEYEWVKAILGDKVENYNLSLLLDNGVDLHNYQPTAGDIIEISECDLFIYVGGEGEQWTEDVFRTTQSEDGIRMNLIESLGEMAKEEEIAPGMETEEEECEEPEKDEHIWLSLKNAEFLCNCICENICELDSENSETYKNNTTSYVMELKELDKEYQSVIDGAELNTLIFGDRFPFRYLVDDYGLEYYAAFSGCSAETEASFETVKFLAEKVDETGTDTVLTLEGSDNKIAQTVISNTKTQSQQILSLNSMQGTVEEGETYLSLMRENLEIIRQALA